jgi:hypothetical protein
MTTRTLTLRTLSAALLLAVGSASVMAQTATVNTPAAHTVQRDVNQQTRIENGLKDGSLTTKEAGRLEKEESRIDRQQAADLKDGKLSPRERAQLRREQDRASRDIAADRANAAKGNPQSASSQRLQADVQRNVNQEARIEQGVKSGALTGQEAGKLERGQAHADRKEAIAARDGHLGAKEQAHIQHSENRQGDKTFNKKHNVQNAKG